MKKALDAVRSKEASVSKAAKVYSVPRKTLDDRVRGKVLYGEVCGPGTVLTATEEDSLCNYLIYMSTSEGRRRRSSIDFSSQ